MICVSINGPGDPDFPFDLETVVRVASKVGLPFKFGHAIGRWVLESFAMHAADGQTDGQTDGSTDGQKQR